MDLKDLLSDSSRKTIDIAVAFISDNPQRFEKVLDFAMQDEDQYAMRAARVINLVALKYPSLIQPHLSKLIINLDKFRNNGLRRGVLKTISEQPFGYDEDVLGKLVDVCFTWFNDPGEEIAVKVYALDVLYRTSTFFPEIKPELISSIENELPRASKGVHSRGLKMLATLYKEVE